MQHSERQPRPTPRDALSELARRVEWLRQDHRDPNKFHEEKSEIAHELAQIARQF